MSGIQLNFNAANVEPNSPRELYEAGKYAATLVNAEMKPTKSGDGQMLVLQFQFLDGAYAGKKITDRLNLANPNPQAVEIAYRTLSALCRSVNVLRDDLNTNMLMGIPLAITVKVRPGGNRDGKDYDASNEIDGYEPIVAISGGAAPTQQAGAPWQQPQQAAPQPQAPQPTAPQAPQPPQGGPPAWQPPAAAQPWEQPAAQGHPVAPQPTAPQPPQYESPAPQAPAGAPLPPWQRPAG
jgi:hypothetical protein